MNKKLVAILLMVIVLVGSVVVYTTSGTVVEPEAQAAPVTTVRPSNVVSAEAFVVPLKEAEMSFETSGRVVAVDVEAGDLVTKGQVLAQLDDTSHRAKLAEAEAGLAEAQASLADVQAGVTPQEIAQAEASLARAEAVLAELLAGPTAEEMAEAEARVEIARANLTKVLAGSRDEDIQAAASRMMQAEAEVRLKQADYDKFVYGDPQVAEPYGVALQRATLDYEAAQAEYNKLVNGATDEETAVARAQLYEAQKALERVQAGTTPEKIAQAQADVAQAEAVLAQLKAGPTGEKVAVAEAGVQVAAASLRSVQTEVTKTQLAAPFVGTVGAVNVDVGEIVGAGTPVLALGDTSRWQLETDDLTEIDVVKVREGARVKINIDALPGEAFAGKVVRITPKSETKSGDVTYTVLIDITRGNTSGLRWGMTSFVDIEPEPEL